MVTDFIPQLGEAAAPLRSFRKHFKEDFHQLRKGILDPKGFLNGYCLPRKLLSNPTELKIFDGPTLRKMGCKMVPEKIVDELGNVERAHWTHEGKKVDFNDAHWGKSLKAVRRSFNLRVTMGRDQWQRGLMFGNITANASSYTGATGAATATTATSLTNSGAAFPTTGGPNTGLQGQVVVAMAAGVTGVFGVICSNTATALTIDQWTNPASATGAAGSTPGATTEYLVLPWNSFALWVGLSTNSSAAAAGDVLRTADGLFSDGTTGNTATEQNANGLVRTFIQPTFPGAGQIQLQNTWTYTSSSSVTIAKGVLCNTKPVANSLLILETLTSATATVTANGDTIQLTWTINL